MELPFYNFLGGTPLWMLITGGLGLVFILGYTGARFIVWTVIGFAVMYALAAPMGLWIACAITSAVMIVPPIRRLLSAGVMKTLGALNFLPAISATEKEAIDAGTVWVEGELFSGKPDFKRILGEDYPGLTAEEQAFIDGPVQHVCEMTDDWEVFQHRDLPEKVWQYLKDNKFMGMIIPKEYGGLGFSASANSAVVAKLASSSTVLGISVMVPNSLGPAELLIHYGTEKQKNHYLPRLADGTDLPAFALTEPTAGSDAGGLVSDGVVFKGEDGKLYIRLNWRKRYITLAAISTVLGLAFKLKDPENLLGKGENPGITCALVPTETEGVVLGMRHDPMGVPFYNCPTEGHDVVLPLEEAIIGGVEGAGRGWRMLMESLAAGRGISLPATGSGSVKAVGRMASSHARVRKQFGLSIGKFEGIEEPLARIGGFAYLLEAARRYTNGGLDKGAKPAVVTAIAKYNFTELARTAINDGMDILGGNAISRGPRNLLAHAYVNIPVSITVEGANILTRTLMIFGQGAIRSHPYTLKEILALETGDVKAFDANFWKHIGHVVRNMFRAIGLTLTRGRLAIVPVGGLSGKYLRKIAWASASFAFMADLAMGTLGGDLKRKEKLTGRFADIFSWMYLGSTAIKRFEEEGRRKEDEPFLIWSMEYALQQMQEAFDGLYKNMRVPLMTWLFRGPIAAWSRFNTLSHGPSDTTGHTIAAAIQEPGEQRDRMFSGIFVGSDETTGLARLERAFRLTANADPLERKVKSAIKAGTLPRQPVETLVEKAVEIGVLSRAEADQLAEASAAAADAIEVDHFSLEEYKRTALSWDIESANGSEHVRDQLAEV